jgi:hypothetical protein
LAELGTRARGSIYGDGKKCTGKTDEPDEALRAHHELVEIEAVHVGDYVLLDTRARPDRVRCVLKKFAKTDDRAGRVVGWLMELTGGHLAWWPRGGLVWRRRSGAHVDHADCSSPGMIMKASVGCAR